MATFAAFGVRFAARLPLPELADDGSAPVECLIHELSTEPLANRFSGPCDPRAATRSRLGDGRESRIERGVGGDHLLAYGDEPSLWLSPDRDELVCAAGFADDPARRRYLLDTGLGFVGLARGHEALHAGAVRTPGGLVAIAAGEGGGKSTLVAELLRRGSTLFTDDLLMLTPADGTAHPGPPLMNLPPVLADGRAAGEIGRVLAELDGECWVAVDRPAVEAAPVAAVVLLERGAVDALSVTRLPASPMTLLPHSLQGGGDRARNKTRFEACSAVASAAVLLRVEAPADLPAAAVADAVLAEVG